MHAHPHQDDKFQVSLAQGTALLPPRHISSSLSVLQLLAHIHQPLDSSSVSLTEQQPVGAVSSRISHVGTADRKTGVISEPST